MKRWYVVQTKFGQEETALAELRGQKFIVFYPTYFTLHKNKKTGKVRRKHHPLFPSYMFIRFDPKRNPRWKNIPSTRGVKALVGCSDVFLTPVPKGCVEEIKRASKTRDAKSVEKIVHKIIEFIPNMAVMIHKGNMAGHIATYCNHSKNRAILLLTLLNQKVRVILPLDAISHIPPSQSGR